MPDGVNPRDFAWFGIFGKVEFIEVDDNGGATVEHLTGKGTAVFERMPNAEHVKKLAGRGIKVMTLEELQEKLK